jgi:glycosyltransferase involved in cell wall biosynthesis
MNVLLVVGPATGGIGVHLAGLATGLPALGCRVTVFTGALTAGRFDLGPRVVTGWPSPLALRREMRVADVVHAHGHQAGLLALATARTLPARRRPPVIVAWHNAVLAGGWRGRLLALAERAQARGADLVTGASGDLVERAARFGAREPELAEVAATLAPAAPGARTGNRVLTVSRIAPQKRLDVVVEAAARLARRRPGLDWSIAGDGDAALLAELRHRVERLGAPVTFLGARTDVPALMASADVFALASDWEARALVVQEAMASRLPVVATAVGGLPGLLGDTGLLVPPGDVTALADAVGRLLDDPALAARLAGAAAERVAGFATEADVAADTAARYARVTRSE